MRGPHERRSSSSCPHEPKGRDGGDGACRRGRSNGGEVAGTWRWPDLVAPGPFRPDPTAVRRGRRRGSPGGGADHVEAQRGQGEKKRRERKGRGEGRGRPGGARCCSGEDADGAWCGSSLPWSSGTREREATRGLSRAPDGLRWAAAGLAGPAAVGSAGVRWRRHMAAQGWLETARGDVARPDWSGARRRRRQVAVGGWMCTEFEEEVGIAAG